VRYEVRDEMSSVKGSIRSFTQKLVQYNICSSEKQQPIFNIKSPGCRQSMALDNRTPSAGFCPRRRQSSRNNGRGAG